MTTIGIAGTGAPLANIWLRGRTPTADYVITIARFAYCGTATTSRKKRRVPGDTMTEWGSLHIEVVDGEIVVTAPFSSYTVTY
jgi:hypothetical protein